MSGLTILNNFEIWHSEKWAEVNAILKAITAVDSCKDLQEAKVALMQLYEEYSSADFPGKRIKDESTDHQL